jgi:hypothetical protein
LTTALRSALAEIEDYQRVKLDDVSEITLSASIGPDIVLMFAELLDNATSFSPPDSVVEVGTEFSADGTCLVRIVDHGIGMTPERLAEENGRLVERERLDVAPTAVLGLFVVGRLMRRHSLAMQLMATPGGGVTVQVAIPATLYSHLETPQPVAAPAAAPSPVPPYLPAELVIPPAGPLAGFTWFMTPHREAAAPPASQAVPIAPEPALASRGGLERRVPGAQLVDTAVTSRSGSPAPSRRDAAETRQALDGYQSAIAQATGAGRTAPPVSVPPSREDTGLSRRVPGANLAPDLRTASRSTTPAGSRAASGPIRDPDAELAAFDAFSAGVARAELAADSPDPASIPALTSAYRTPVPRQRTVPQGTPQYADVHNAEPTNGRNA